MNSWELNARVLHDSGHHFKVVYVNGNYAVLQAEADGQFGVCELTSDLGCGFNVLRDAYDNYVECAVREDAENIARWVATGGREGTCPHLNTAEGVDEEGELLEPAFDVCRDCGARID